MDTVLWVVQGLLAAMFLFAGLGKLARSREDLVKDPRMAWAEDFSAQQIRGIGVLEILGAAGLVLPALLDVAPVIVAVAAAALALLMLAAARTHLKRGETPPVAINMVLFALAAFVAVMRFGPEAF